MRAWKGKKETSSAYYRQERIGRSRARTKLGMKQLAGFSEKKCQNWVKLLIMHSTNQAKEKSKIEINTDS